jgi:MFS family permease
MERYLLFGVEKDKRAVMWTILLIALIQMPHLALSAGINNIREFFGLPETTVQTAVALPNLIGTFAGVAVVVIARYRRMPKKAVAVCGVLLFGLTGIVAAFFHSAFWQVYMFSVMLGVSFGAYIPNVQSIMMDTFNAHDVQVIAGAQSSFINAGGIIFSLLGGAVVSLSGRWYAAYILLAISLPIAFVAMRTLPEGKLPQVVKGEKRGGTKMHRDVFYYMAIIFVFMILYNVILGNISEHLKQYGLGDAAMSGLAVACVMGGGVVAGLLFPALSSKLHSNMATLAFGEMAVGYTLIRLFPGSTVAVLAACVICGMSLSSVIPFCNFSVAGITDPSNSALSAMMIGTLAPGVGSFLSPVIMTNVTQALFGDSTAARFLFTGLVALAVAVTVFLVGRRRDGISKSV